MTYLRCTNKKFNTNIQKKICLKKTARAGAGALPILTLSHSAIYQG